MILRMKIFLFILPFLLGIFSCQGQESQALKNKETVQAKDNKAWEDSSGKTIYKRFPIPIGYEIVPVAEHTWAAHLLNLPLKPSGSEVKLFDGRSKPNRHTYLAVVDLPIGKKDLHQCADAVMRLRADYLFSQGRYTDISFRLASGKTLAYGTWLDGKTPNTTNHWSYLEEVFNWANTTSLNQQLKSKSIATLHIGDVFITPPPPGLTYGHAIIVVNKCTNKDGKVKFMLAQSFMPAQEIQILDNPAHPGCPWYDLDFGQTLDTPEWDFTSSQLKTFE